MTPHTIYFVRHGETVWNFERRLQGRLDSPLTDLGRVQAKKNGETLRELVGPDITFISSPMGRARATTEIIRETMGISREGYVVDPRLAEISLGDWDGLTFNEVQTRFAEQWRAREAALWTYVPPGGESYQDTSSRLRAWLSDLSGNAVVVGHGIVGKILRGLNLGLSSQEIVGSNGPKQDRIYRLHRGTEAEF